MSRGGRDILSSESTPTMTKLPETILDNSLHSQSGAFLISSYLKCVYLRSTHQQAVSTEEGTSGDSNTAQSTGH